MRRILLSNTLNTRDLGGYSIGCGKETKFNAFLRSDVPVQVSDEDIQLLLSNYITTIVDLRNEKEIQRTPCAFQHNESFQYHHCRLHENETLPKNPEAVPDSYLVMVDEQKTVLNIMRVLANAKGGALFHCVAGKDRTGVITALLLLLAGVSKTDIADDYEISKVYLGSMLQHYCKINRELDINVITPQKIYMEKFLDMFHQKYNSVEEYFSQIGLSQSEIMQLKIKITGND